MGGYYHLSVTIIGRSTGRSAVACAAYRSGEALRDERYGKTHDYGRRRGIRETGIAGPVDGPAWVRDREQLWNAVEARERRKDSQLAREFVLAFPHQLTHAQRKELLDEFIGSEVTSRGLVADWAIHAPSRAGDERNWHAHILVPLRSVTSNGFGEDKNRDLNNPDQLMQWREKWAEIQNRAFERYQVRNAEGRILRVDHRSFEDRGMEREATVHLGVHATSMERRGKRTELGDLNRDIERLNKALPLVRRRAAELSHEISQEALAEERAYELDYQRRRDRSHGFDR